MACASEIEATIDRLGPHASLVEILTALELPHTNANIWLVTECAFQKWLRDNHILETVIYNG